MADIIVVLTLIIIIGSAVLRIRKNRKNGNTCMSCSCASSCTGSCTKSVCSRQQEKNKNNQ